MKCSSCSVRYLACCSLSLENHIEHRQLFLSPNANRLWSSIQAANRDLGSIVFSFWEEVGDSLEVVGHLNRCHRVGQALPLGDERVGGTKEPGPSKMFCFSSAFPDLFSAKMDMECEL